MNIIELLKKLFSLLFRNKVMAAIGVNKPDEKISLKDLITSSGRYVERKKQMTPELEKNAKAFLIQVNSLLKDLAWEAPVSLSSGFRPQLVNSKTKGAATGSLHTQCRALDIVDDKEQTLAKLIESRPELLKRHGLWLEHPSATKGQYTNWVHLDNSTARRDREIRIFKP